MKTLLKVSLLVMLTISLVLIMSGVVAADGSGFFIDKRPVVVREVVNDDFRPIVVVRERPFFSPFFLNDDLFIEEEEFFGFEERPFFNERFIRERDD
ncbi:MAG: hypothetical protein HZA16_00515 [Nitrospirae bacterium]|nr:hypothetical protein [Nitrospirota bacterium]